MSKTAARIALVFALVGLAVASEAAYVQYRAQNDPTYVSFCDVSATVSCSQVYASRFSTFYGVPVSVFGAIWFAFAALLAAAGLVARPAVRESVPGYLFAGSTLALAAILYLAYASFVLLKLVCVLCLITYAAVIGLFIVSGAATSIPMMSLPRRAANDFRVLIASPVAVVLAVLFAGFGSLVAEVTVAAPRRRSRSIRARRPQSRLRSRAVPPSRRRSRRRNNEASSSASWLALRACRS